VNKSIENKTLIQSKKYESANSSCHRRYERHNTEVDGRMHSEDAKIADMIGKHLKKKKLKIGGGG
jgi:hypothetical protein